MDNCTHELNKQIKGIQARLSQAENNITSHFIGTSLLVQALLGTPAAAAGAAMESIYNLVPSGFDVMQQLISQIPAIDTKALMYKTAAALEDAMAAELEAITGMVESAIESTITDAEALVNSTIAAVEAATIALEDAIAAGISGPIILATTALNSAKNAANSAQEALNSVTNLKLSSVNMLKAQADAASCKSVGLVIES